MVAACQGLSGLTWGGAASQARAERTFPPWWDAVLGCSRESRTAGTPTLQGSGPWLEGSSVSAGVSGTDRRWVRLPTQHSDHRMTMQRSNPWDEALQPGGGRPRTLWQQQGSGPPSSAPPCLRADHPLPGLPPPQPTPHGELSRCAGGSPHHLQPLPATQLLPHSRMNSPECTSSCLETPSLVASSCTRASKSTDTLIREPLIPGLGDQRTE